MVNPIKLPDGKEIQIHELDVDSTIKDKIAIHYKINPRLIQKYKVQDETLQKTILPAKSPLFTTPINYLLFLTM